MASKKEKQPKAAKGSKGDVPTSPDTPKARRVATEAPRQEQGKPDAHWRKRW